MIYLMIKDEGWASKKEIFQVTFPFQKKTGEFPFFNWDTSVSPLISQAPKHNGWIIMWLSYQVGPY